MTGQPVGVRCVRLDPRFLRLSVAFFVLVAALSGPSCWIGVALVMQEEGSKILNLDAFLQIHRTTV